VNGSKKNLTPTAVDVLRLLRRVMSPATTPYEFKQSTQNRPQNEPSKAKTPVTIPPARLARETYVRREEVKILSENDRMFDLPPI
jgi:hypothetical protein